METRLIGAFLMALFAILASELGDRTFIVTTIMAMRYSRVSVFCGALSAAVFMISLSVLLGVISSLIPESVAYCLSIFLFVFFGVQMLIEGFRMSSEKEIKEKLEIKHEVEETMSSKTAFSDKVHKMTNNYLSIVFIEAFAMTFFAEWGDRSQISTIVLASRENIVGVSLGAITGQCICNAIAVIGGGFVGQMISTRTVTLIGGTMFLLFAVSSLLKL